MTKLQARMIELIGQGATTRALLASKLGRASSTLKTSEVEALNRLIADGLVIERDETIGAVKTRKVYSLPQRQDDSGDQVDQQDASQRQRDHSPTHIP